MRIFVTGATGFIGSFVVPELLAAGHQVLGLTRSEAGADALRAAGADVLFGTLEDPEPLRDAARSTDGIIHLAFDHNMDNRLANCEKDRRAVEVLAAAGRPLVVTSGVSMGSTRPGLIATEDVFDSNNAHPRIITEIAIRDLVAAGSNISTVRLPQVHDTRRQGIYTYLVMVARQKGVSAYVGDGSNRIPAVHVTDTARLYRLALQKQQPGAVYHAVAEEGVPVLPVAEALGRGLNLPARSISAEEALTHFGWLGVFVGLDMPASSAWTREHLGWNPTGPGLLADLANMDYSAR